MGARGRGRDGGREGGRKVEREKKSATNYRSNIGSLTSTFLFIRESDALETSDDRQQFAAANNADPNS